MLLNSKNQELNKLKSDNYKLGKLAGEQRIIIDQLSAKNKDLADKNNLDNKENTIDKIDSRKDFRKKMLSISKDDKVEHLKKVEKILTKDYENERVFKKAMELKDIDLRGKLNLLELDLSENELTSLNLSSNVNLRKLNASWNQLTSLDLSKNPQLKELFLSYNQL